MVPGIGNNPPPARATSKLNGKPDSHILTFHMRKSILSGRSIPERRYQDEKNWQARQALAEGFPHLFHGIMDRDGDQPNNHPFILRLRKK